MSARRLSHLFTALALATALVTPLLASAQDDQVQQSDRHSSRREKAPKAPPKLYPDATRVEPKAQASSDAMVKSINQLHDLVGKGDNDAAIALAQTMLADPKANAFDKAAAWQGIGYASFAKRDYARTVEGLTNAIAADALPNNDHFQTMFNLARAQVAAGQPDAALSTVNRLASETRLDKPEYDGLRGMAYYGKKDYAHAVTALQKSLAAAGDKPDPNDQQMLFASYFELQQFDKAVALAESIQRAHPDDKAAMMNLASTYQRAGKADKAQAVLDDARKRGMLTTSADYRNLILLYSKARGSENETIAIINEGLQKGILQPAVDVYSVLAQDYYALGKTDQAIAAYQKADAVASNGEAALNLARVYNNAGRRAEAKAAAERALAKGVSDRAEAQRIIAVGSPVKRKK